MLACSQPGIVGDVDGDVIFTVVEAFVVVDVDDFVEGDDVAVGLAGSDVRAVAGLVPTGATGLERRQGTSYLALHKPPHRPN